MSRRQAVLGVAMLEGAAPDLITLAVRLPPELDALAAPIIAEFIRREGAPVRGMTWRRIEGGRIVEAWDAWNQGALVENLRTAALAFQKTATEKA